ncbi:MAG TPA: CaiB/BaiF CoA-transferase family protein, partial [Methylomirabilota bacterium]|nr:CaiB/BaiF CoA-transferase family protein [Methylomirabilota bacterium]
GYDQIAQGMGGLMSITGLPGQGPVRVGIPVADLTAGIFLAQGILVALLERERSGKGQWVHTSLLQAMVTMLDFQAARWLIGKEIPPQAGNDHPTAIPTGVFKTADGHLNIAASGQHMFRRLCETLGTEPLLDDPRFRTAPDRSKNRKALAVELEKAFGKRTTQEWVELLNAKGVPSGPILDVQQVYENEQIRHLKMAVPVTHPALGELSLQAPPVTLSRTPGGVRTPAPDTGEHNDEILTELGYSTADIASLRNDKVI